MSSLGGSRRYATVFPVLVCPPDVLYRIVEPGGDANDNLVFPVDLAKGQAKFQASDIRIADSPGRIAHYSRRFFGFGLAPSSRYKAVGFLAVSAIHVR